MPSGLIPAHAGKTRNARILGNKLGAHPRSRGENRERLVVWGEDGGSSPLTRGKQRMGTWHVSSRGLIPAHAGKTSRRPDDGLHGPAHPRSRGENRRRTKSPQS